MSEIARRVAEAKRKVESMSSRQAQASTAGNASNPYLAPNTSKAAQAAAQKKAAELAAAATAKPHSTLHPLLANLDKPSAPSSSKDRYKPMLPKFASTKVNLPSPSLA